MSTIPARGPVPLKTQIIDDVRRRVASGELQPGDQLPPEGHWVQRFGASLPTVRNAFKVLTDEGLVYSEGRRGRFVGPRTAAQGRAPFAIERIVEDVVDDISTSRLRPGDRLPKVDELMATYGVSRITVLRAISELKDGGWIVSSPPLGLFVADEPPIG
ncbi:winged helix-turn-helix domain-containing protein [Nonomuraea sp. NPDC050663]|uniref:winged helix-turn-helix domain-containing protein n=1 Tax=Nonomuraea sp. NPDC050663 TaxID=3364370 RepID=UPI00379B756D